MNRKTPDTREMEIQPCCYHQSDQGIVLKLYNSYFNVYVIGGKSTHTVSSLVVKPSVKSMVTEVMK